MCANVCDGVVGRGSFDTSEIVKVPILEGEALNCFLLSRWGGVVNVLLGFECKVGVRFWDGLAGQNQHSAA